jgi:hypothetical protein
MVHDGRGKRIKAQEICHFTICILKRTKKRQCQTCMVMPQPRRNTFSINCTPSSGSSAPLAEWVETGNRYLGRGNTLVEGT